MSELQEIIIKIIIAVIAVPTITALITYYFYKKYVYKLYKK